MNKQNYAFDYKKNLIVASTIAVLFGASTILLVFAYKSSGNHQIHQIARFLSDDGNVIYLLASNAILIAWAWRKNLNSLIKMALFTNFFDGLQFR